MNISKEKTEHLSEKNTAKKNAEHGMEQALEMVMKDPYWKEGFSNVKCEGGGLFSVKIEPISEDKFKIISTGIVDDLKKHFIFEYKVITKDGKASPQRLKIYWK